MAKDIDDVFIVESLSIKDVQFGNLLAENLRCSGKNPIFLYVKNEDEFRRALSIFHVSKYRYLLIICHGNTSYISLNDRNSTNPENVKESIDYQTFLSCFPIRNSGIRIFIAACKLGNRGLSDLLMTNRKYIYSVAAPEEEIPATHALYVWSTFFNQMFADSDKKNLLSRDLVNYLWNSVKIFKNKFHLSIQNPKRKDYNILHYHVAPSDKPSTYDSTPLPPKKRDK